MNMMNPSFRPQWVVSVDLTEGHAIEAWLQFESSDDCCLIDALGAVVFASIGDAEGFVRTFGGGPVARYVA